MSGVVSAVGAVALAAVGSPAVAHLRVAEKGSLSASVPLGLLEARGIYGGMLTVPAAVCLVTRERLSHRGSESAEPRARSTVGPASAAAKLCQGMAVNAAQRRLLGLLLLSGLPGLVAEKRTAIGLIVEGEP